MLPFCTYRQLLFKFRANEFYLSRKKTKFFVDMENGEVDILSGHVQNGKISVAKSNVDASVALHSPTCTQVLGKGFRGM